MFGRALSCGCLVPCELHGWAGKERCCEHPDLFLSVFLLPGQLCNAGSDWAWPPGSH